MIGIITVAVLSALATAVAIVGLWLWQENQRGGPPGPLTRRLGPFLDLLDARYLPLLFVATPQAYTVYAWLLADGAPAWVAVLGGAGFEAVYVGAIAWAERGAGWQAARPPAVTALIFSIGVAVAHYGVKSGPLAILHIGFPLVGYAYTVMMHAKTGPNPAHLQAELGELRAEVDQARAEADHARTEKEREVARAWDTAKEARAEMDQLRAAVDQTRAEVAQAAADADHWRAMAAQAASRPALAADHDTLTIAGRAYSARAVAQALNIPKTTLTRKLADVAEKEA